MDSGILVEYADIYRRLLGQKNPGAYFIKLRATGIVFYGITSTKMAASRHSKWVLVKIFTDPHLELREAAIVVIVIP